jgi:hypothetical protein
MHSIIKNGDKIKTNLEASVQSNRNTSCVRITSSSLKGRKRSRVHGWTMGHRKCYQSVGAVVMESAMQLHSYCAQSGGEGNVSFHVTKKWFENLRSK